MCVLNDLGPSYAFYFPLNINRMLLGGPLLEQINKSKYHVEGREECTSNM